MSQKMRILARAVQLSALIGLCHASVAMAKAAPEFQLPTRHGSIDLRQLRGHVVLVDFWASWCGPCHESFPWMNRMYEQYKDQGLRIIAINVDSNTRQAKRFLNRMPAYFTVAFDPGGKTPDAYGVMGMPSSYLVGPDGQIEAKHIGFHRNRTGEYEASIRKLLQNRAKGQDQ